MADDKETRINNIKNQLLGDLKRGPSLGIPSGYDLVSKLQDMVPKGGPLDNPKYAAGLATLLDLLPMAGGIKGASVNPEAMAAAEAHPVLSKITTPEQAQALTGESKTNYQNALDEVFGPKEQRMKDMGFSSEPTYHGSPNPNINAFENSPAGGSKGKFGSGVYTTDSANYADQYAGPDGKIYELLSKDQRQPFNPSDLEAAKQVVANYGVKNPKMGLLRSGEQGLNYLEKNIGIENVSDALDKSGYRMFEDFGEPGVLSNIRVNKPSDLRLPDANFDPRFSDSSNLMAGETPMATNKDQDDQTQGYADGGFIPDSQFQPDPAPATSTPGAANFIPDDQFKPDVDPNRSPLQEGLSAVEGAATMLPGADYLANKMRQGASAIGVPDQYLYLVAPSPEERTTRAKANPLPHLTGAIPGAVALTSLTGGIGAGLAGTPLEAGLSGALGSHLAAGAAEGALLGAQGSLSDAALGDPDLGAQKVLANIGFGTLTGGFLGGVGDTLDAAIGKFGVPKGSLSHVVQDEIETSNNSAKTATAVGKLESPEAPAPEVKLAAERQGLPALEGMTSDNPWVQKAEDSLINGAPTYSGIKRAALYEDAYNQGVQKLSDVVPDTEEQGLTKASVGEALQNSHIDQIEQESAPISEMYNTIKQTTQEIPLSERSAPAIARNIMDMQEVKLSPGSPEAKLATRVADEISNLKTVDDVKQYRAILNRSVSPTASAGEKRIVAILADKLQNLEDNSITRYAEDFRSRIAGADPETKANFQSVSDRLDGLMEAKKQANAQYKPFIEKVGTLAEQLGKKRVYGPQDAINFIKDLTPEQLTQKLFAKNNSKFLSFYEENFPQQMALMRQYQKQVLREQATAGGVFSPRVFFNKINKLEPEIQKALFFPDELAKIKDLETYFNRFPKNFNPSGTSGMNAFREFFKSPTGAAIANARDLGIEAFIKSAGALPEGMRPNPFAMGTELAQRFNKMNAVQNLTNRTDSRLADGIRSVITGGAVSALNNSTGSYDQRVKRISELASNGDALQNHLANQVAGIDQHLPNVAQAATTTISNGVQFLNSKIPKPAGTFPLSQEWKPSITQKDKFNSYYDTVNDPIHVLKDIRKGTINNDQMEALSTVYPKLLEHMQNMLTMSASPDVAKKLPHHIKSSLSFFLGKPLTEGTYQPVMMNNQNVFQGIQAQKAAQQNQARPSKSGAGKMKISKRYATETQTLEDEHA